MHSPLNDIITPRLILRLLGEKVTHACLASDLATAQDLLGATIPEEFLTKVSSLEYDLRQLQHDPGYSPWASRAIILPGEMKMMGLIRFHGSPDPHAAKPYMQDAVELGYRIFSSERRKGYAREAIMGVMNWAMEHYHMHRFIASVSPENIPSLALVQSLGFMKVDEVMDETDGIEHVFLLDSTTTIALF